MKTLFALALFLGATLSAGTAHADAPRHTEADQRPCVSWREFNNTQRSMSRAELEARWEVTGLGVEMYDPEFYFGPFIAYPKCGYEKGFPRLYWYGVQYTENETGWKFLIWDH